MAEIKTAGVANLRFRPFLASIDCNPRPGRDLPSQPLRPFPSAIIIGRFRSGSPVSRFEEIVVVRKLSFLIAPLIGSLFICQTGFCQDWAREQLEKSPRHGEWVVVEHGDRKVDAFVVYPEVADPAMSVVVIHEIFGMTDWVRTVADQLAEAGYIAIAPDLLSGMAPGGGNTAGFENTDGARRAIGQLPPDQITADLNACAEYVSKLPAANGKVVVGGFCWGGSQTFRFATNNKQILAAFPFYGTAPADADELARIECPVYGFYGGNDARVNATIPKTEETMKAAGKTYEPVQYEGAGHGFLRAGQDPSATGENVEGRAAAWERWKKLLGEIAMKGSAPAKGPGGLSYVMKDIQGNDVNLADYHGQVLMIVNVASKCGLTPQYAGLQSLQEKYQKDGLVVLGFPCNQFMGQEPGTNEEIATFCTDKYNVTFPMFSKIDVNDDGATPLYKYLTGLDLAPVGSGKISWNFEKFLIGRDGKPVARFSPRTKPDAPEIAEAIKTALGSK